GFAVPSSVATDAVRSYRTLSPLPAPCGTSAVCFLLHFPWARAPQALPGTLSTGARTFLPEPKVRGDCLASSRRYLSSRRPCALARAAQRRRQCLPPFAQRTEQHEQPPKNGDR